MTLPYLPYNFLGEKPRKFIKTCSKRKMSEKSSLNQVESEDAFCSKLDKESKRVLIKDFLLLHYEFSKTLVLTAIKIVKRGKGKKIGHSTISKQSYKRALKILHMYMGSNQLQYKLSESVDKSDV